MTIYRYENKANPYNGSDKRMFGHKSIQSCVDTDGKYPSNHKVWITEEKTANLLGVDFCHLFLKALYFDISESIGSISHKMKEIEQIEQ